MNTNLKLIPYFRAPVTIAGLTIALALAACNSADTAASATGAPSPGTVTTPPIGARLDDFDLDEARKALADAATVDGSGQSGWDKAEELTVELSEFAFTPSDLTFKVGHPYKLTLSNTGAKAHDFVSDDFFKAVAAKELIFLTGPGGEEQAAVSAPYFIDIDLDTGKAVQLLFIPLHTGEFRLICEVPGHESHGMHGSLRIVD